MVTVAVFLALTMIEPGWAGPLPTPPPPPPMVQVIYAIPSDREFRSEYAEAVREAILHVQGWYADQLEDVTFVVDQPTPLTCHVAELAAYFELEHGWNRTIESVQHCAPVRHGSARYVWAIYIDVDFDCDHNGELGRGGHGVTIVHGGDLSGLMDPDNFILCGSPARSTHGWIGGLAHELGHAFSLPHPPGCDEDLPSCDYGALMKWGYYWDYPDTYLTADDVDFLAASPFFTGGAGTLGP